MFLHHRCHACLKTRMILFEISRAREIVAENEREGKEEDVGNALFLCFEQKLGQGARLSRPLLKQKACDLAHTQEQTSLLQMAGCPDGRPVTTSYLRKSMGRSRIRTSPQLATGSETFFTTFCDHLRKTSSTLTKPASTSAVIWINIWNTITPQQKP